MADLLKLNKTQCAIPIGALNTLNTISKNIVIATIHSRINGYERNLSFLTIPTIANWVPDVPINRGAIKIPKNIKLADPEFHKPAPVDMLIGAGTALSILCVGQIDLTSQNGRDLVLQKTQLGWVIGGSVPFCQSLQRRISSHATSELYFDLSKFWTIEEGKQARFLSQEESSCEEHFRKNVTRGPDGRYSMALPFNDKKEQLGESRFLALRRLQGIERKLSRDPDLNDKYHAVLQEYLDLGHMSEVKEQDVSSTRCYLPHHAVLKNGSLTTAVRVVFDGSAKTSTNLSLNNTLLVGPTIQDDLFTLLLRFRKHTFVLTGDVEKMYRQFLINKDDRKYQRIVWRKSPEQPIRTYELNTITFGLASAPYLAIRGLHQLANDEENTFPQAARVLRNDFYVDDLLSGTKTIEEARKLRSQLEELLARGQLKIRQWASNSPAVLAGLPEENINQHLLLEDSATIKTLGVKWNANTDSIIYTVKPVTIGTTVTKRTILSEISKIFDPLGLLAPVITTAKIFMQKLWNLKLDWDESLPTHLYTSWSQFKGQLMLLNEISFSRKAIVNQARRIELHGFCDASEKAYGACIYTRSIDSEGEIHTTLLCSKSRVAPVKTVSIPRLELCGAVLLTNLMSDVQEALQTNIDSTHFWTDSTIVLHWLRLNPQSLKTFVANRVAEIQGKSEIRNWQHVRTNENPADLVSRGQSPQDFIQPSLWQQGPTWLQKEKSFWKNSLEPLSIPDELLEKRKVQCLHVSTIDTSIFDKYSSITKLQTTIAYALRFKKSNQNKGHITISELRDALEVIIRQTQRIAFPEEIHALTGKKSLKKHSRILCLNPFIDEKGLLRVGGRLKNAIMPFSQRHPLIIPKSSRITTLLIEEEHRSHLHAGIQATLYALRRRFWIIDGRNAVRKVLRNCITCCKLQPPSIDYIMADLPRNRVSQFRPFSKVGIDYCGPFFIKEKRLRNRCQIKVYVAIFVCFAVKAVHIELVSDLSTDAFIAALRRFIARRGLCDEIYTDNGTNFVGAHNELKELHKLLNDREHQERVEQFSKHKGIKWHFIPARAPNFGGLWEASVKSFKHHLRRVIGVKLFTYEELNTFIVEIEAILNSRPLTPISSDPNDLLVLTPGHFLIGDSMTSLPEHDLRKIETNRLSNWQHLQQARQHFWSRWSREYLNELTVRHKWTKDHPSIKEGTVVLIKEDNLPPLRWVMGRIKRLHPGPDGVTRVVEIQTANNTIQRSVKKIAPLPLQAE